MPLHSTREVIDGVVVIRFNGNNSGGSSKRGQTSREKGRSIRITSAQKRRAVAHKKEKARQGRWTLDGYQLYQYYSG